MIVKIQKVLNLDKRPEGSFQRALIWEYYLISVFDQFIQRMDGKKTQDFMSIRRLVPWQSHR